MSRILKLKNKMNMKNLIKYGFIAVVMLSFMSCSKKVHDYDWKWGETVCKEKGGLRYIKTEGFHKMGCMCQNGEFKYSN